eukprot:CAMPEP_0172421612 /NCGR_PEP_ID=MMETSP1064-20121228/7846_1 /TAXON_ID=202472 /ORGANISM="Aulacoseira subarctica , Strain CCAP 1002/5" /LENGTH=94 /DNA_ID=CAMNT_0013162099 /DNA_START=106 /DNA_END=386 /DNA_ORIENTATION=+
MAPTLEPRPMILPTFDPAPRLAPVAPAVYRPIMPTAKTPIANSPLKVPSSSTWAPTRTYSPTRTFYPTKTPLKAPQGTLSKPPFKAPQGTPTKA